MNRFYDVEIKTQTGIWFKHFQTQVLRDYREGADNTELLVCQGCDHRFVF